MIEEIIKWFGNQSNMARGLGVSRSSVNQWRKAGGLPSSRAVQVERLSGGKFKAVDIAEVRNGSADL